jgi:hypothetical protein
MVEAIFSARGQKQSKKGNSRGKKSKKGFKSNTASDNGIEAKPFNTKIRSTDEGEGKPNHLFYLNINLVSLRIEEKKIDLSVRPKVKNNSMSASKPKLEIKTDSDDKKMRKGGHKSSLPQKLKNESNKHNRNKKYNLNEEVKNSNIPKETVYSFYQCEDFQVNNINFLIFSFWNEGMHQ